MQIDLSSFFEAEKLDKEVSAKLEAQEIRFFGEKVSILKKEPVVFHFSSLGKGKLSVTGSFKFTFDTRCDGCLEPVETVVEADFDRVCFAKQEDYELHEEEDPLELSGYLFDVEAFLLNEILINWPMKILCKKDCKGICPVCGANNNLVECGCDTFVPDPRMAVIQDIFNAANKEV
ncbi:MAG: DUF177 domain-containing protein [Lachnospiraceae bacterium]|nr:DUF177 domain-containing protein [Lachnospiraceae bacterium]